MKRIAAVKKTPASAGAACPHPHREGGEVLYKQDFIIANWNSVCYSATVNFLW